MTAPDCRGFPVGGGARGMIALVDVLGIDTFMSDVRWVKGDLTSARSVCTC